MLRYGIPNLHLIYTEHNTNNRRRDYNLSRYLDRFFYNAYTKIISISDSTKSLLLHWLKLSDDVYTKDKFLVIPNGARSFSHLPSRNNYTRRPANIVSIGSLSYKKGFDKAIKAIKLIDEYVSQYVILGEGPMRDELQKLINENSLSHKVHLVGHVTHLQDYLSDVDVGLVSSRVEGFGLCAVELLSAGVPVVCTNIPGITDILSQTSAVRITKDKTVEAIADALLYAINNLAFSQEISHTAVNFSRQYSVSSMLQSYQGIPRYFKEFSIMNRLSLTHILCFCYFFSLSITGAFSLSPILPIYVLISLILISYYICLLFLVVQGLSSRNRLTFHIFFLPPIRCLLDV